MYKSWQQKHFPLHDFDEAMLQIADLGKSNRLKVCDICDSSLSEDCQVPCFIGAGVASPQWTCVAMKGNEVLRIVRNDYAALQSRLIS